ncbi:hypothetical protein [Paenibacillus sp. R14(2021)]|uniref:hypothetical protein n=1 Tax=Paenibacillus sp. R14(2021) TaxID=2859228 RepID=UPI001C61503F|nr:hypothetical protein [Paenibacillus sp. R14(2021)]
MARSKARKRMEKQVQQGGLDPRQQRGHWNGIKPITRVKPDKRKYAYPKNDDDRGFKHAAAA